MCARWPTYGDLYSFSQYLAGYLSGEPSCDWESKNRPIRCTCTETGAHRCGSPTPGHASFYRAAQVGCALIGRRKVDRYTCGYRCVLPVRCVVPVVVGVGACVVLFSGLWRGVFREKLCACVGAIDVSLRCAKFSGGGCGRVLVKVVRVSAWFWILCK